MTAKKRDTSPKRGWLTPQQQRAWVAYMRVQLRMNYEMNRQLQADSKLSLSDYDVLVALSGNRDQAMRISDLAARSAGSAAGCWPSSCAAWRNAASPSAGPVPRTVAPATWCSPSRAAPPSPRPPAHVDLVRSLFFDPLPDNLLAPLTAALEHIHVNLNLNSSLPPAPG